MLNATQKMAISDLLRPASPPRELDNVYSEDQLRRLLGVMHDKGC